MWKLFEPLPKQKVVDQGISGEWKMMAVLLDSGGRKDEQSRILRQGLDLLPIEISKVAGVGDPGLHGRAASSTSGWKLSILPGFSRPLGS